MMNTNSKILPSQDSNLSCYSPSTLTFSAPAFYLSSFLILVELGLGQGWGQAIHWGQFSEEQFSQFQSKGSRISRLNFLRLKTELLHGGMHTDLKGLIGFNLLFLFCSQRRKESLNVSNFFYHLTFQPREKYSNFSKTKRKKKRSMIIKK